MTDNGKFQLSHGMVEYFKISGMSVQAGKLLLALCHFQHLEDEEWPRMLENGRFHYCPQECASLRGHYMDLSVFRRFGISPASNDARFFRKAVEDLRTKSPLPLFDDIACRAGSPASVIWKFSTEAAALMADRDRYALMEIADLAHCSTALDLVFLTQLQLHHRMRMPEFTLLRPDTKAGIRSRNYSVAPMDFSSTKRTIKRCLEKWSAVKGYMFAAEFRAGGETRAVTDVRIRVKHSATKWPGNRMLKYHPRSRFVVVGEREKCEHIQQTT